MLGSASKPGLPSSLPLGSDENRRDDAGERERPHHAGHRQRLRARFLDAGAKALADYELLELLLFRAIRAFRKHFGEDDGAR